MQTFRTIQLMIVFVVSVGYTVLADGRTTHFPPVDLTLSLRSQRDGAAERRASLSSGARTLLFRDRVRPDSERERVLGYESPSISAGPLRARGYLRSIEAPLSGSPVRDGVSDAGGYRLRGEGGFGDTPDVALRLPFAGAYHRDTETFVLTGVGLRASAGRSAAFAPAVHAHIFAARSTPQPADEPSEWLLDRASAALGPVWFTGIETSAGAVRAELLGVGGPRISPGLFVGVYMQERVGRGEIRGSLQGRSLRFVGADGRRPDERMRAGVRYERIRGPLFRPLIRATYHLAGLEAMPDSYRGDGLAGAFGTAIGPTSAFIRPRIEARVDRDSSGVDRTRLTARLDGALGGEAIRLRAGFRRSSDSAESGRTVATAVGRVNGFIGRIPDYDDRAGRRRVFAGFGRAEVTGDEADVWQLRARARMRALGYDPQAGNALHDYGSSEDWQMRLSGDFGVERGGFHATLALSGDGFPIDDVFGRAYRSAVISNLEGELRVRWRTRFLGTTE